MTVGYAGARCRAAGLAAGLGLLVASALHAAPGDPAGGQFQVNTYTTYEQSQPAVAPDGAGGFVVVWQSYVSGGNDDDTLSIQARRFSAAGTPVGPEFQVNSYTTGSQRQAKVVQLGSGRFVVVWRGSGSSGNDRDLSSIQAQLFESNGMAVGGEFQVNTYTTGSQYDPAVGVAGTGFVVVWTSQGNGGTDTSVNSVQQQRFDGNGAPQGGELQVNSYTTGAQYHAAVSGVPGGGYLVVWASEPADDTDTSTVGIRGRLFDAGGTPPAGDFQVNTYTTGYQVYPSALATGDGFVVVWQSDGSAGTDTSDRSVQLQRYDAAGARAGGELQVNTYTTLEQDLPRVGTDGAGGIVVIWESRGSGGTDQDDLSAQARRFDAGGAPLGGEFQVNTYTTAAQTAYGVSPNGGGGFVVVWDSLGSDEDDDDERSIQAQQFEGPAVLTTTTVASPSTSTSTSSTSSTTLPDVVGEALPGQAFALRVKGAKSALALRAKTPGLTLGGGNQSEDDPVLHGGTFGLSSDAGAFSTSLTLAGGWRYLGKSGQNKGYRWTSTSSPVASVVLKRGKRVAIVGRGAGLGFDLDGDPKPVRVTLGIGRHLYCFAFGGQTSFKAGKRFTAKKAAAPGACP